MKTALVLRHVPFEDLGTLAPVLRAHGFRHRYWDVERWNAPPPQADLVVVMGGPIGACEDDKYPFLRRELALIERRLASGAPTLGICLGAQLMARALGARVGAMGVKEIGFAPVALTAAGRESVLVPLAAGAPVLHWHGDQFEIPANASRLAQTATCANQAFEYGRHALALQFHLEVQPQRLERWLVGHACELDGAGIARDTMRRDAVAHGVRLRKAATECFGAWLQRLA